MRPLSDSDRAALRALIQGRTRVMAAPLATELRFHGADELTSLWEATEATLSADGLAPPFWAFAWPGGVALARYLLDHPETVRGRRVAAIASGAALEAIAAARAGATVALALDSDPAAAEAALLNASLNGATVSPVIADVHTEEGAAALEAAEVLLVGDAFYEKALADRLAALLGAARARGATVLIGDPGRGFPPPMAAFELAAYRVKTDRAVEDVEERLPRVLTLTAADPSPSGASVPGSVRDRC